MSISQNTVIVMKDGSELTITCFENDGILEIKRGKIGEKGTIISLKRNEMTSYEAEQFAEVITKGCETIFPDVDADNDEEYEEEEEEEGGNRL